MGKKNLGFVFLLVLLLFSCKSKVKDKIIPVQKENDIYLNAKAAIKSAEGPAILESDLAEYADYYVLVADTSFNYSILQKQLFELTTVLHKPIDTLGRSFNKRKNLIALPDDDEDEIYAGDYFPRRVLGESLSLEYLAVYQKDAKKEKIALVSGIYENQKSADSVLTILQQFKPKAFKLKSHLYIGCMH